MNKETDLMVKSNDGIPRVNSKVRLKTTKVRMAGLKVRRVRNKFMLSVPSNLDEIKR